MNPNQDKHWQNHPFIATVMWLFGENQREEDAKNESVEQSQNQNQKNHHDEYTEETQINPGFTLIGVEGVISQEINNNLPHVPVQLPPSQRQQLPPSESTISTSPNWGFWVNMTPPLQDVHARQWLADSEGLQPTDPMKNVLPDSGSANKAVVGNSKNESVKKTEEDNEGKEKEH